MGFFRFHNVNKFWSILRKVISLCTNIWFLESALAVGRCEMECCHKQDSIPFNSLLSLSSTSKFLWAIFQRCNLFDYNLLKYAIEMVQKISIISHIQLQYLVGFQNVKCLRATSTMYFPRYQNRFFFFFLDRHPMAISWFLKTWG